MKSNGSLTFQKLAVGFLCVTMCVCLLSGVSWAWFAADLQSADQTITAATFDIGVSVVQKDGSTTGFSATDGQTTRALTPTDATTNSYELLPGGKYTVTLTASGTASGGYCAVAIGGISYNTVQLIPGATLQFDVANDAAAAVSVQFGTKWGTPPEESSLVLSGENAYSWTGSEFVVAADVPQGSDATGTNETPGTIEDPTPDTDQSTSTSQSTSSESVDNDVNESTSPDEGVQGDVNTSQDQGATSNTKDPVEGEVSDTVDQNSNLASDEA
ncbi:hypothetical protein [uncultured Ruthenibacterium sp.]|uniref:hypothetical protein n=1 Tax=uncultured Ruthenibacterium sp. TaxID=1905347 RepID=UPI00349EE937